MNLNNFKKNIYNIAENKNRYKYIIEKEIEVGIVLQGWEVKAIRLGKIDIKNSYILIKNKEFFLIKSNFSSLLTNSIYSKYKSNREKKLLLKKKEINLIIEEFKKKKYTIILLYLYWKNNLIKAKIGIAKGKKKYDKRIYIKNREWNIEKSKILKKSKIKFIK